MATLSAASRVFVVTELLEAILQRLESNESCDSESDAQPFKHGLRTNDLPPPVIQLFSLQRVNRHFQATILGSGKLQHKLNLKKYSRSPCYTLDNFKYQIPEKISKAWLAAKDQPESWKSIKVNGSDSQCMVLCHYTGIYKTDSNTTLGMILDWETRTAEELNEAMEAKKKYRREREERMSALAYRLP